MRRHGRSLSILPQSRVYIIDNRVDDEHALPQVNLHLIGPIQSRKAELAVACRPVLVHSVDRLRIAGKLDRLAGEAGLCFDILLEVNVAGEASKFGFTPDGLWQDVQAILALPALRVRGLMTIPPYDVDPEERVAFRGFAPVARSAGCALAAERLASPEHGHEP